MFPACYGVSCSSEPASPASIHLQVLFHNDAQINFAVPLSDVTRALNHIHFGAKDERSKISGYLKSFFYGLSLKLPDAQVAPANICANGDSY